MRSKVKKIKFHEKSYKVLRIVFKTVVIRLVKGGCMHLTRLLVQPVLATCSSIHRQVDRQVDRQTDRQVDATLLPASSRVSAEVPDACTPDLR